MHEYFSDIVKYLEYLAYTYPRTVELITIGHSYEGQPIKMVKISTGPTKEGGSKPAIWIDAGEVQFPYYSFKKDFTYHREIYRN